MSVVLEFQICQSQNCKQLIFTETTGSYNATSNPNGYGGPNEDTTDATAALLTLTVGGTDYVFDLFDTGDFPTTDDTIEFIINSEDIGLGTSTKISDQVITFSYSVTTPETTYNQNFQQAFYCQVSCCVYSMFKGLDVECDCSLDQQDNAIKAYLLLQGLISSAGSGNIDNFNSELETLQKLCLNKQCQNCK